MIKIYGQRTQIKQGEWKQSLEILHEGKILGFVDHFTTSACEIVRTRNMQGEVKEGECLDWLLCRAA
jgi:hypothetical protein